VEIFGLKTRAKVDCLSLYLFLCAVSGLEGFLSCHQNHRTQTNIFWHKKYALYLFRDFKNHKMGLKNKTLSSASARLLAKVHDASTECFRAGDAYAWLPDSKPDAVRQLLAGMVRRGLLMRIF
jgi:hypothetical protein